MVQLRSVLGEESDSTVFEHVGSSPSPAIEGSGRQASLSHANAHFFETFDIGFHRLEERYPYQERHRSNGFEVRLEKGRVGFLAEFAHASITPVGRRGHFREGYYFQPSYRITPKLFAVARYDFLDRVNTSPSKNALAQQSVGLTYRPVPGLSLKVEADRYEAQRGQLPAYYGATVGIVYFFHLP